MLKIINDLKPFFEDCYRRINVREYARITNMSPPTASKLLTYYKKEGLLLMEEYKNYILFYANKENKYFIELSRMYWRKKLEELVKFIEENTINPTIILFGSASKGEIKIDSDLDLTIFAVKKDLKFDIFEKTLKRKIQVFWFKSLEDIKNKDLTINIINGYIIKGKINL